MGPSTERSLGRIYELLDGCMDVYGELRIIGWFEE